MWKYKQSTGQLFHNEEVFASGYSGRGEGKDNPSMQEVHNVGPIPQGVYQIGEPKDTPTHGPFVLPLSPSFENQMFGRSGFLIHGDSISEPGTASEGCMIFDRQTRERIHESGDNSLEVVE